jgi:hypothetical protein
MPWMDTNPTKHCLRFDRGILAIPPKDNSEEQRSVCHLTSHSKQLPSL